MKALKDVKGGQEYWEKHCVLGRLDGKPRYGVVDEWLKTSQQAADAVKKILVWYAATRLVHHGYVSVLTVNLSLPGAGGAGTRGGSAADERCQGQAQAPDGVQGCRRSERQREQAAEARERRHGQ